MSVFNLFSLLGGLAMFLFGMDTMGKALEKQAGGRLHSILSKMTDHPLKGFGLGLLVTAVIQSSSATTVMVVGFVNSGLMQLHQAIGIIMGANVGTTVTAWILSLAGLKGDSLLIKLLKPSSFSPIMAFIGIILYMFCKSEKKKGTGTIFLGFAILMTGMSTMSGAVEPLADEPWFTQLFLQFSNPILGILAGAMLTAVIQSSSASVGILQALSATGVISYGSAIPIIMGQNIGTCVTAMLSSIGANKNARRAALVHLYFNIIGVVMCAGAYYALHAVIGFGFVDDIIDGAGIAVVHSAFNLITTLVLLPFGGVLERLAMMTIPDDAQPEHFALLDKRLLSTPSIAAERARITADDMSEIARTALLQAMSLNHKWDEELAETVRREENALDRYEDKLGSYLVELSARDLSETENRAVNLMLHTIGDFERIGDFAIALLRSAQEIEEKQASFSADGQRESRVLEAAMQDLIESTVLAFQKGDLKQARQTLIMVQVVKSLVREAKSRHIARLQAGTCSIEHGFILNDQLTTYERVSTHCNNVAVDMLQNLDGTFDTHADFAKMREENSGEVERQYEYYRGRYQLDDAKQGDAE